MRIEQQFPAVIDNTVLKDWRMCPQRCFRRRVQGLTPIGVESMSIDLHFGSAHAAGLEAARKAYYNHGYNASDALSEGLAAAGDAWKRNTVSVPPKSNKTFTNLVSALQHHFHKWPLGADGLRPVQDGVEVLLQRELPFTHPDTGKPLLYVGRLDLLAHNDMGGLVILDDKTTSRFSDAWHAQWDMDPQMTGYIWLAQEHTAAGIPHALIRGIELTASGVDSTLVPVFRSEYQIDLWYYQLQHDVDDMLLAYQRGHWHHRMGSNSCVSYARPCEYTRLCTSPSADTLIEGNYRVKFWNPLSRD